MIEIKPWMAGEHRFIGILIYLPKCTMRMLVNMKIICLDDSFDHQQIEKRCRVPVVGCESGTFEEMMNHRCTFLSESLKQTGITMSMSVKEAIACVFQNET